MSLLLWDDDVFGGLSVLREADPLFGFRRSVRPSYQGYRNAVERELERANRMSRMWSDMLMDMDRMTTEVAKRMESPSREGADALEVWRPFSMDSEMRLHVGEESGGHAYAVEGALPKGVDREHVSVKTSNGMLTVESTKHDEQSSDKDGRKKYRRTSCYVRESIALPKDANVSEVSYEVVDGKLRVHIPRLALSHGEAKSDESRGAESSGSGKA